MIMQNNIKNVKLYTNLMSILYIVYTIKYSLFVLYIDRIFLTVDRIDRQTIYKLYIRIIYKQYTIYGMKKKCRQNVCI